MAADRLSDLPEDLLRRILYFAPAKEGASTAVLSRRWRFLWQTSGAVNLDSRSYDRTYGASLDNGPKHEAFLQGAMAALRAVAANGPVKRLSLHIESVNIYSISRFVFYRDDESETDHESETDTDQNLISKVMSNPAARSVEELHIAGIAPNYKSSYNKGGYYKLRISNLPFEAVRVLHIINAELLEDWSGASFPLLNSLLLHGCHVVFKDLQSMIHGAPHLTTVRLESINILHQWNDSASGNHGCTICGPEVTSLVLTDWSGYGLDEIDSIALDMPKLEYFRYEWFQSCQVSMKSQVWNMTQADLHFKDTMYDEDKLRVTFWHFLRNFGNTKVLRAPIHGAPQLATVRLESIYIESCDEDSSFSTNGCQIRGQEVTALVLTDWTFCGYVRTTVASIEFDMPKLRYFRFDGVLNDQLVSLKSCVPNMPRVDFHFKDAVRVADKAFLPFWNLLGNLTSTKVLKLKVDWPMDHIAVVNMKNPGRASGQQVIVLPGASGESSKKSQLAIS
ncbi:hypothetical protein QOZ80_9AG0690920 [Eleusine coracana subsp. coracana]|nr:hypothetical protein QOZ80_9AG0690920 [Eleusine coracana subsp. coracana]